MATQLRRLSVAEFLGCLIDFIEGQTGIPCYDDPNNKASPLFSVDFTGSDTADTKTEFIDVFHISIHCVSEPVAPYSNAPVLELANKLDEAMTAELELPSPYQLQRLDPKGYQILKRDESDEGHVVFSFDFHIRYGFCCK